MHDDMSHETAGESRRDFLKKTGTVAWVVPAIQVVNMTSAAAGVAQGSVVTTTPTRPPRCIEYKTCRIKAEWKDGGWHWDSGVGRNDCIQSGDWERCDVSEVGAKIEGNESRARVTVPADCKIKYAQHKAGQDCFPASISNDKRTATFEAGRQGISNVVLVVECCVKYG